MRLGAGRRGRGVGPRHGQGGRGAFRRLDILVNNAALTVRGGSERLSPADYFAPFEDYKREVWDQAIT